MIVIVWEFRVRPGRAAGFERAYGPNGDWARLFQHGAEYRALDAVCEPLCSEERRVGSFEIP